MAARRTTIRQIAKVIYKSEQRLTPHFAGRAPQSAEDSAVIVDMISRSIMRAGLSKKMDLIKKEYEQLCDAASGTVRVRVVSARELPTRVRDEAEADIVKLFGANILAAEWSVDPVLVGGLRAQTDHYEIRSSVADMLHQL